MYSSRFHNINLKYLEFFRFCIVGVIATGIDAGLFFVLKSFMTYKIAMAISYCASLCVNYVLTIIWTFKTKFSLLNALGIVLAHLFNLFVVRFGLMKLFIGINLSESIAYWPTLIISVISNFLIIRFIINKLLKK